MPRPSKMNNYSDTIAALSSAHGKAGVAVIRISGEEAVQICERVFFPKKRLLSECAARSALYGEIKYRGVCIDTGICVIFKAPFSYTGEDTVEISAHGSEVGVSMILAALYENGARAATAGEFTKRAFLNGKLDLNQAEAVASLIESESSASQILSNALVKGALSEKINSICERLQTVLASVYAYIDYPDENLADMTKDEMKREISEALIEVDRLASSYDMGRAVSKGISAAIVGSPNVGKSSFLNLLTNSDRAIVTSIAGTTRDVITETVTVENVRLNLSDTAGIHESDDEVEKIGIQRSKKAISDSEIIFALFDISAPLSKDDEKLLKLLSEKEEEKRIIYVLNKSDISEQKMPQVFEGKKYCVMFSAKTKSGEEKLKEIITKLYPVSDGELEKGNIVNSARKAAQLKNASECLSLALTTLRDYPSDLAGQDIEKALEFLLDTDARGIDEKIVNSIFSHFCVGK